MKYFFFLLSTLAFFLPSAYNQTIDDAVRYSVLEVGGTARTVGVGGAIGALGADFSVLSTNPAGIAAYRRSEFVFTPTLERITTEARLDSADNVWFDREKNNFNFNNLGLVIVSRPMASDWTVSAFGIGLNRLANFHQQVYFQGISPGSITDRWLELAQGFGPDELNSFEEGLAYDALAIYPHSNLENQYVSDFNPGEPVNKSQIIRRKGSINELAFSFGGNYKEKLMIGATIGVPILNFEETKTYMETDSGVSPDTSVFDELTFTERLQTSGAGINLKLGVIYRLSQMVRLGFAFHTPTGFGLDDSWSTSLDYHFTDPPYEPVGEVQSPEGSFEYRLRTPWRFIGSAGFIFEKAGFLSAEVEWVDYTNTKFNFNKTDNADDLKFEQALNDQIDNELASALNLRLGGEFALSDFRIRGGYALTASPFEENGETTGALSLGAGFRHEDFFLDFAYRRAMQDNVYVPYYDAAGDPLQSVDTETTRSKFMMTVGFKF